MANIVFRPSFRRPNHDLGKFLNDIMNAPNQDAMLKKHMNSDRLLTNINETDEHFLIVLAIPGFAKDQVTVLLEKNQLVVSGNKPESTIPNYRLREYQLNNFTKKFDLPENVDITTIGATFDSGLLTITLPKSEVKTTVVEIK